MDGMEAPGAIGFYEHGGEGERPGMAYTLDAVTQPVHAELGDFGYPGIQG